MEGSIIKPLLESFFQRQTHDAYRFLNEKYELSKKYDKLKIKHGTDYVLKLKELNELSQDTSLIFEDLYQLYISNIKYGSKYLKFFNFNQAEIAFLLEKLDIFYKEDEKTSLIQKKYPYLLNLEERNEASAGQYFLVNKTESENEYVYLYSTISEFTEKQAIPLEYIENLDTLKIYTLNGYNLSFCFYVNAL